MSNVECRINLRSILIYRSVGETARAFFTGVKFWVLIRSPGILGSHHI
jgi:hypothetical protein